MHHDRIGLLAIALLTCAVAACGGGSTNDEVATATTTTAGATTTTETPGEADVDLRFTGTYVLQIKGKYGECTGAGGRFAFSMSGKTVDGIGEKFAVEQVATGSPITWKIDSTNSYDGAGAAFSSAGTSVQIDEDLKRVGDQSGAAPRPEHVAGTITCP